MLVLARSWLGLGRGTFERWSIESSSIRDLRVLGDLRGLTVRDTRIESWRIGDRARLDLLPTTDDTFLVEIREARDALFEHRHLRAIETADSWAWLPETLVSIGSLTRSIPKEHVAAVRAVLSPLRREHAG